VQPRTLLFYFQTEGRTRLLAPCCCIKSSIHAWRKGLSKYTHTTHARCFTLQAWPTKHFGGAPSVIFDPLKPILRRRRFSNPAIHLSFGHPFPPLSQITFVPFLTILRPHALQQHQYITIAPYARRTVQPITLRPYDSVLSITP
jgi:hypothetical protein